MKVMTQLEMDLSVYCHSFLNGAHNKFSQNLELESWKEMI
jgi:hypothetical protein